MKHRHTFSRTIGLRPLLFATSFALLSHATLAAQTSLTSLEYHPCLPDTFEPNEESTQAAPIQIGTTTGLTNENTGNDHYRFQAPPGQYVEVTLRVQNPSDSISSFFDLFEIESGGNGSPIQLGNGSGSYVHGTVPQVTLVFSTPTNESTDFLVSLFSFGDSDGCLHYEIDVALSPSDCGQLASDTFQSNFDCNSATPINPGTYLGLRASVSERDYYLVDVGPGDLATFELHDVETPGRAKITAWNANDSCQWGSHVTGGIATVWEDTGGIYIPNTTEMTQSFLIRVEPQPEALAQSHLCMNYAMQLSVEPGPCGGLGGDRFEPNDTWDQATLLTGTELDLTSTAIDADYYDIIVPAKSTLTVTRSGSLWPHFFALYSEGQEFYLRGGDHIGVDADDIRHQLEWTNTTLHSVSTSLHVAGNSTFPGPFCGEYDLEIDIAFGNPFCPPSVNSTGFSAEMSGSGSQRVGQGQLILTTSPTPVGQFGLVFFGQSVQLPTPLGAGTLCIPGQLHRLPIASLVGDGLQTTIDWQNPGVAAAILPGSTWSFQTWYRDHGGESNASQGLRIRFE